MATGLEYFERDLRLATAGLEPDQINKALAAFAKQELRRVISSGQASPNYERYVNETKGLPEEAVRVPGAILYVFVNWSLVVNTALEELQKRSPVKSGRFRRSFIVLADQRIVYNYENIGPAKEVVITNFQPYVRKAENGLLGTKRYAIFDGTKGVLDRRFNPMGGRGRNAEIFTFETMWLNVRSGVHPGMPYILKNSQGKRKDRQAGMPITYPSIVINAVGI